MRGTIHQAVKRARLLLLAVILLFCAVPTARALRCPPAGLALDSSVISDGQQRPNEEMASQEQDACYVVWAMDSDGRIGLFVGNNPISNVDPYGLAEQLVGLSFDLNGGRASAQYSSQRSGQDYGIGLHGPLGGPSGGFFFSGFARQLPKNLGKIEGIGFVGYNKHAGIVCGGIDAFTTKHRFLNGGFGTEAMWSSHDGWSLQNVAITDLDLDLGGIGQITGQNGETSFFFYVQLPIRFGDAFWGIGIDR